MPITPISIRLIHVNLPSGMEVLITNLMDKEKWPHSIFKHLYHLRWGIEENYKRLKQWAEIENFSGKSALSVKQDFHAKIVSSNLTAIMVMVSQKIVTKNTKERQLKYQVNFAQSLSKMKHCLVSILRHAREDISSFILQTVNCISQTIEAVREGRVATRSLKNLKNDIHFTAYKSAL